MTGTVDRAAAHSARPMPPGHRKPVRQRSAQDPETVCFPDHVDEAVAAVSGVEPSFLVVLVALGDEGLVVDAVHPVVAVEAQHKLT